MRKQKDSITYRLVSNYGFGDKSWLERGMSADEAVKALNGHVRGANFRTIEDALAYDHPIYTVEEDHPDDEEDWDWMDS